ncbi:MAG: DNA ligase D [Candidatus Solibacter usitatus]|nr:DNA ligase D [Candidatus Solibacter usitatus]
MALDEYAKKRSFDKTPEPAGDRQSSVDKTYRGEFCVQRHHARQLHYDLRIEVGGTLKSWAVPEGPTLDPGEKRLAVHVEDHPMEYATFEGVIPKGNYGAGSMMLWDHGSYEVIGEPAAQGQMERGDFKFHLKGRKLRGDFVLVRTKQSKGRDWLLIKKKDEHANPAWDASQYERSVKTGRTQVEIATGVETGLERTPGAVKAAMPTAITPMMAFAAAQPPADPGWSFEVKWDGVRALCYIGDGPLRMISRNGNAMERRYPELATLADSLDAKTAIVDGEIVALDERGLPSFGLLQHRMHVGDPSHAALIARKSPATLYLFDLLYLDGYDLRKTALEDRRRLLASVLKQTDRVKLSDHFIDQGRELMQLARQSNLEGIVAKRLGSVYESRRSATWLKIKVTLQQEFVICGYGIGEREPFGSLILGLYEDGKLLYVGNVGSGFDQESLASVFQRLQPLVVKKMPFARKPEMMLQPVWTKPALVCQVKFSSWTDERRLRAPVFLGLRDDLSPEECIFESTAAAGSEAKFVPPEPLLTGTREKMIVDVEGRRLSFTNLNKIYYPAEGYCKRDLINYYYQVSDLILPYLRDRALSLRRYPDGIHGESFFQKDASEHFPDWLRVEPVYSAHNEAPIRFVVAGDRAALLFLANLGCIDQNPWMSRIGSLDRPDFLLIDLDPQDCDYDRIVEAAQLVRQKLDAIGLVGYPKTTGGDGMHIYVPIEPVYLYEQARAFVEVIARIVAVERPDLFTLTRSVSKRERNRVYFDFAQLSTGKTISAPYVLRAYAGAPVATPLEWREVRPGLTPSQFHLKNALERFSRVGDLFAGVLDKPQRLEPAMEKLERLVKKN